ncbi:sensor histidine kinase [Ferruginibacter albus]|uniref:sensor histidine kinase n=1 Tax=Ferruginibacter albus TaxID=2875540 RepID=UPI001CC4124D|nr:histidine kinase [Ferruginibacter albus]UAY50742.1 two-component sensor histidine kinase [Ferruginibacter albus]
MIFLQVTTSASSGFSYIMLFGTLAMISLTLGIVFFVIFHQRKVIRFNNELKRLEDEKQQILLNASIKFQEEERNRIAADLHDDVGPLLATARLYLNENLINQEPAAQLQSIFSAKQIIDDSIQLIRNISHSMMPPTLRNFGLESAMSDLFQKINGSGTLNASVRFHDYRTRLKLEQELLIFRIIQELINNIIKHSNAGFIHLTQNANATHMYLRLHHDGQGIVQAEFDRLNHVASGLGLKNIASRVKVLNGRIYFEIDPSHTYYKVTLEVPKELAA